MAEETRQAIEDLVKMCDQNDLAKAFLTGFKSGMQAAGREDNNGEDDKRTS